MIISKLLCLFNKHNWVEDSEDFDSDWGGVIKAYYCDKCGLIKQITYNNTYYVNLYFVEWFAYTDSKGVHVDYDVLFSESIKNIIRKKPRNAFLKDYLVDAYKLKYYHYIVKVKPEHLKLNKSALQKLYSYHGDYNERCEKNRKNIK